VGPTPLPAFGCGEVTVRAPLDPFLVDVLRGLPPLGWCTGSRDPSRTGHGVREGFGPIRAARPRIERFGGGKVFFLHGRGTHRTSNGNPNPHPNLPSPPINVGVFLPLRFDVPRCCAPRRDRTPAKGARRRGGGLRRWLDAMRKRLDTRFPAVSFR
jgi:hypothetical protein